MTNSPPTLELFESMSEEEIYKLDGQTCIYLINELMLLQQKEGPDALSEKLRINSIHVLRRSRQLGGQASEAKRASGKANGAAKKPAFTLDDLAL